MSGFRDGSIRKDARRFADEPDPEADLSVEIKTRLKIEAARVVESLKREGDARTAAEIRDGVGVRIVFPQEDPDDDDEPTEDQIEFGKLLFARLLRNPFLRLVDSNKFVFESALAGVVDPKAFVDLKKTGVVREDLVRHKAEWAERCSAMINDAQVLALKDPSTRLRVVLFPRIAENDYQVRVSGTASAPFAGCTYLVTSHDLRCELRRGDAIVFQNKVYRVSGETTATSAGRDVDWLSLNAAPYSASSVAERKRANAPFKHEFDATKLPIHPPFRGAFPVVDAAITKYGCTNDVRDEWHRLSVLADSRFVSPEHDRRALNTALVDLDVCDETLVRQYDRGIDESVAEMDARRSEVIARPRKRGRIVAVSSNAHMAHTKP